MVTHLSLSLGIQRKEVIQRPIIDAPPLILLNVRPRHGVRLPGACLSIGKYADIVACIVTNRHIEWKEKKEDCCLSASIVQSSQTDQARLNGVLWRGRRSGGGGVEVC